MGMRCWVMADSCWYVLCFYSGCCMMGAVFLLLFYFALFHSVKLLSGFRFYLFIATMKEKKLTFYSSKFYETQHHLSLLKSKMALEDLYTSYTLLTSSKEVINHTALLRESRTPPKRCPNGFYDRWHAICIDKCEHFPLLFPSSDEHVWREAVEMRVERIRKP